MCRFWNSVSFFICNKKLHLLLLRNVELGTSLSMASKVMMSVTYLVALKEQLKKTMVYHISQYSGSQVELDDVVYEITTFFPRLYPFEIMLEVKTTCTIYPLFIVFKETDNCTCLLEPDQGKIHPTTTSLFTV